MTRLTIRQAGFLEKFIKREKSREVVCKSGCREGRKGGRGEQPSSLGGCSFLRSRKRAKSGWKEIVSALTEARKLLPTFN